MQIFQQSKIANLKNMISFKSYYGHISSIVIGICCFILVGIHSQDFPTSLIAFLIEPLKFSVVTLLPNAVKQKWQIPIKDINCIYSLFVVSCIINDLYSVFVDRIPNLIQLGRASLKVANLLILCLRSAFMCMRFDTTNVYALQDLEIQKNLPMQHDEGCCHAFFFLIFTICDLILAFEEHKRFHDPSLQV